VCFSSGYIFQALDKSFFIFDHVKSFILLPGKFNSYLFLAHLFIQSLLPEYALGRGNAQGLKGLDLHALQTVLPGHNVGSGTILTVVEQNNPVRRKYLASLLCFFI
jgi:hypothetical protein